MTHLLRKCSVRFLKPIANTLYCHRCGQGNPPGSTYCGGCGGMLNP